jgi:predicted metal-binding membrane protein
MPTQLTERSDPAERRGIGIGVPVLLLAFAALGWWWSVRMVDDMRSNDTMAGMDMGGSHVVSLAAFVVGWLAMMTAMMFPAISPIVKMYARAARARRVAPLPCFVAGYIAVWTSLGVPAYFAWRALMDPIADGRFWAARLAGGVLVVGAIWQLTPMKSVCLRHCRSPMSFFLHYGGSLDRPVRALRVGATHGLFCVGCCWALMAILVALGTMNLAWMLALAVLILLEKNSRHGEHIAVAAAAIFLVTGVALLVHPATLTTIT